ncbi:MAG: hypothetical protein IPI39_08640 [Candidatus Obscuribacter sp.]|nr:hypothetical protein [Candidatus Obscuribacter sp.]
MSAKSVDAGNMHDPVGTDATKDMLDGMTTDTNGGVHTQVKSLKNFSRAYQPIETSRSLARYSEAGSCAE